MSVKGLLAQSEMSPAGTRLSLREVLYSLPWNQEGLIAAIAQQHDTLEVLMLAWMNRAALEESLATGRVCYWSRSRQQLWRKGETSGAIQRLIDARLDCDGDAILLRVDQHAGACHTGRSSCFYNALRDDLVVILSDPGEPVP